MLDSGLATLRRAVSPDAKGCPVMVRADGVAPEGNRKLTVRGATAPADPSELAALLDSPATHPASLF